MLKEKMCRMWGALMATWGLPEYRKDSYLGTQPVSNHAALIGDRLQDPSSHAHDASKLLAMCRAGQL